MSLKSKFKAFASVYKSALENGNNDEWSDAGKDVSAKDALGVIGKGSAYLAKEAVEFSGILAKATGRILMTPTSSEYDTYEAEYNSDGYRMGHSGYGYYVNGIKIHD